MGINMRKGGVARTLELLIVEDNPSDVELLIAAFRKWNSNVHLSFAGDGEEALDMLLGNGDKNIPRLRPDFILLDLNLPRKDGIQVLSAIKSAPELQQIPVVVLTTSDSDEDVSAAYGMHANCYLTKTTDVFEFFSKIEALEEFWLNAARLPSVSAARGF